MNCDVLYLEMTTAATDKAEALAGADSSRTLNESYHSSDYSIEEEPLPSQEESAVATARPGDFRKAEPGLRQPLVCNCTHKSVTIIFYVHTEHHMVIWIQFCPTSTQLIQWQ